MPDEIKQKIGVEADEAIRKLKEVSDAEQQLAGDVEQAGDEARSASGEMDGLSKAHEGLSNNLKGMIAGAFSIGALTKLIQLNTDAIRENADATNRLKEAQLDLQFLNQGYRGDELAAVKRASEIVGGADAQAELAATYAQLKSKTASLEDDERIALFEQLVETSLTTTTKPSQLVPLFATASQFIADPERLQAIVRKTQELSPAATADLLAKEFPQAFGAGRSAGLIPEQTAGLLASALKVDEATGGTALRTILQVLSGAATPEQVKILEGIGAPPSMGTIGQLGRIGELIRSGELSKADQVKLFGGPYQSIAAELALSGEYQGNIEQIIQASQGGVDITQEAIRNIFAADAQQATRLKTRQVEAEIENIKSNDLNAQRIELAKKLMELEMRKRGYSEARIQLVLATMKVASGLGGSPELTIDVGAPGGNAFRTLTGGEYGGDIARAVKAALDALPDTDVSSIGDAFRNPDGPPLPDLGDLSTHPYAAGVDLFEGGRSGSLQRFMRANKLAIQQIQNQYNLSGDGTTRFTEDAGTDDLP